MEMKPEFYARYKYTRTGDLSGDLCAWCDSPMIIDKYNRRWTLRCQNCGREVPFRSNAGDKQVSAYV